MADKLVIECLNQYAKTISDGDKKRVVTEAIDILVNSGPGGPDRIITRVHERTGLSKSFVAKSIREATRQKDHLLEIHHIAEAIQ